ncbi:MAG TPA: DUF4214 domain-containing protein [Gemmataceae bacterium]|nr:DUF4214 domain-containing protein [Gemmataceae bacterium]
MEERSLPAVRSVIPLDSPADNTSTFHTLYDALQSSGLAAGDIVQIEAGSSPGMLFNSWIPNKSNLTIQGNPSVPLTELPSIGFANAITITSAQAGFTFQHIGLRLQDNTLTFQGDGTLRDVYAESRVVGVPIQLDGTIAANIINSHIAAFSGGTIVQPLIQVNTAPGAHNLIQGNLFDNLDSNSQTPLIAYSGANSISDVIEQNTLLCNSGPILVNTGVDGLTIQDNDITGGGFNTGVNVAAGAKNVAIRRNSIENFTTGITVDAGTSGTTTSVTIANNRITAGAAGEGIAFNGTTGALAATVEGNELFNNQVGVLINFPGSGIDLGGGAASKGGNNFRGFMTTATPSAGAIIVNAVAASAIDARLNLFGVVDPETVIFDGNDNNTHGDIVAANKLTGNAAYVQALFQQFLRRTGDLNDPNDAGKWVAQLNKKVSRHAVVQGISHLPEALGLVVDDLYRSLLHESPTPAQRTALIQQMADGVTSTTLARQLFASPEYSNQFVSPEAYVQSVYLKLLGRLPTDDELNSQLKKSRTAIAQKILGSKEYRDLKIRELIGTVLHRVAVDAEVTKLVKLDQSLDAIRGKLAESSEFFDFG